MSTQHLRLAQQPATDILVQLFTLDATKLGLGTFYFTPGQVNDAPITYGGTLYTAFPIQISGMELTTQGAQPRPKLSISNIGGYIGNFVINNDTLGLTDLVGAKLSRIRTFARFLDAPQGATPDPQAFWGPQTFIVDRKSKHNRLMIEWELATPLDQKNLKIPALAAYKNNCNWIYRLWNGTAAAFDYTGATCPYTGSYYFTLTGAATSDPGQDQCGKRLTDCKARFNAMFSSPNAELPYGGFPGMTAL